MAHVGQKLAFGAAGRFCSLFGFAKLHFGGDLLSNVFVDAKLPAHHAVHDQRHAVHFHVHQPAILSSPLQSGMKMFAGIHGVGDFVRIPPQLARSHQIVQRLPEHFVFLVSEQLTKCRIRHQDFALQALDDDSERVCGNERVEECSPLPKIFFGAAALAHFVLEFGRALGDACLQTVLGLAQRRVALLDLIEHLVEIGRQLANFMTGKNGRAQGEILRPRHQSRRPRQIVDGPNNRPAEPLREEAHEQQADHSHHDRHPGEMEQPAAHVGQVGLQVKSSGALLLDADLFRERKRILCPFGSEVRQPRRLELSGHILAQVFRKRRAVPPVQNCRADALLCAQRAKHLPGPVGIVECQSRACIGGEQMSGGFEISSLPHTEIAKIKDEKLGANQRQTNAAAQHRQKHHPPPQGTSCEGKHMRSRLRVR